MKTQTFRSKPEIPTAPRRADRMPAFRLYGPAGFLGQVIFETNDDGKDLYWFDPAMGTIFGPESIAYIAQQVVKANIALAAGRLG